MEALLEELYYDPETGFISANTLHNKAKEIRPAITLKQVKDWYNTKLDIQQHAEKREATKILGLPQTTPIHGKWISPFGRGNPYSQRSISIRV
jgi:hypothetical protein